MQFSNLNKRTTTALLLAGAFLVICALSLISCDLKWVLLDVAFACVCFAAYEFARFCSGSTGFTLRFCVYLIATVFPPLSLLYFYSLQGICDGAAPISVVLSVTSLVVFVSLLLAIGYAIAAGRESLDQTGVVLRELLPAVILIGLGGSQAMVLATLPDAFGVVIWLLLVVCGNDIGAYFGGSVLGGPKLAPLVSPNKTVSGSVVGLATGVLLGILFFFLIKDHLTFSSLVGLSACLVVAAQLGDLTKSYLKRLHGVKDSGALFPGHGGMLDRIDGILGAAPLLSFWLCLLGL